jgi:hypothetical protein
MSGAMQSFRDFEPDDGKVVVALDFTRSSRSMLVCTGGAQPKVYTREGIETCKMIRGDM